MAKQFPALNENHRAFIARQHLFFVGSAAHEGRVNVSPKGMDSLRIIDDNRLAWLNITGSGNESAAHVQRQPRMTLMMCSFDKEPLILRIYGTAREIRPDHDAWRDLYALFPPTPGVRQIFDMHVDLVQTSCGYGVPYFQYNGERDTLAKWAEQKGEAAIRDYWREKNTVSIDGEAIAIYEED